MYSFFSSLNPEGAEAFAFLEYTEKIELENQLVRAEKITSLKAKIEIEKEKLKAKSKKRYRDNLEKLKNKQWKRIKMMDINHERELRKKYLMGAEDETFTLEEWKIKSNIVWNNIWFVIFILFWMHFNKIKEVDQQVYVL